MYDLHCHVLPGVDDGSRSPDETLDMCRAAAANGTLAVLATPHRKDVTEDWSVPHLERLVRETRERLVREGIRLELLLGMENHLDVDLADEITAGRALPMNGTRYVLVEMPFFGRPDWIEPALTSVLALGYTPVLAHPERIEAFQQDHAMLAGYIERGMLSQVTVGSLLGHFGSEVQAFTERLLAQRMAHVIASDGHSSRGPRRPVMPPGVQAAARIIGAEAARTMAVDTPRAILRGLPVSAPPRVRRPARP